MSRTRTFAPNEYGYITTWLVSGPLETPIDPATRTIVNQEQYEKYMKEHIASDALPAVPAGITLGGAGLVGMPWRYWQAGENDFVDMSRFYHTMYKCEFWAATVLCSETAQTVELNIRDYTAIEVWLNGKMLYRDPICAYAPMRFHRVTCELSAGENLLFLRAQNSCTRDTRNICAVQLVGNPSVKLAYPGAETAELLAMQDMSAWLSSVRYENSALTAPTAVGTAVSFTNPALQGETWDGSAPWTVPAEIKSPDLCAEIGGTRLTRKIECSDRIVPPAEIAWANTDECRLALLRKIAEKPIPAVVSPNSNLFYTVYARLTLGIPFGADGERVVLRACEDALENSDCSDFRLCYLLKALLQNLPMSESAKAKIREAALAYSYWTDEPAIGAMCYGSENHSFLFHTSQMMAGMLWGDEIFLRSGRTGREQEQIGRKRILDWMTRIEQRGFAEFLSGGYMPITVAALLAAYDFGGGEMTARAGKLLDKVFYELAYNAFDGTVIGPQGRIYRTVLTPWENGTQALWYFATARGVPQSTEWLAAFGRTDYTIPADVYEKSQSSGMRAYLSGGTKIQTYKSRGFMLTSLPVPMTDEGENAGAFLPGKVGYQQHLYYISLGRDCNIYAHHPGGSHDGTQIRPGYWYGNGYFPRVAQFENLLGVIHRLDERHPIPFTHLYFPRHAFDEVIERDGWIFGRKGNSCAAVWCSLPLRLHNGDITQNCDRRTVGADGTCAYLYVCGDETVAADFASFIAYAQAQSPRFDKSALMLTFGEHRIDFEGKVTE